VNGEDPVAPIINTGTAQAVDTLVSTVAELTVAYPASLNVTLSVEHFTMEAKKQGGVLVTIVINILICPVLLKYSLMQTY